MKKTHSLRLLILLLPIFCLPFMAGAQTRLLSSMPGGRGVSKVYLSKALIRLGGAAMAQAPAAGRYMAYVNDIDGIEAYNCDNPELKDNVNRRFKEIIRKTKAEEMLSSEEDNSQSYIYLVKNSRKDDDSSAMIVYNAGRREVNIVVIHGKMDEGAFTILPTP